MQACENNIIKNEIRTISRVCKHRLNIFDDVGLVFEKNIFTNERFKSRLVMRIFNNAFNYICCDLLNGRKWK